MSTISIDKVANRSDRTLPVFKAIEDLAAQIRNRAFALSTSRGFFGDHALEDWLTAEREICWPASELKEGNKDFVLSVALPGFEPGGVSITVTPSEVIVHARYEHEKHEPAGKDQKAVRWSEFRSDDVYRRFGLERDIDVDKVSATLKNGLLTITAPKAEAKVEPKKVDAAKPEATKKVVPISSAA